MMQKPLRLIIFGLLATVLTSAVYLSTVSADNATTTDAQIARIRANCSTVKNTLNQLHANDALLRVNRGQLYESMATKLMSRFNSRATSNNLDVSGLVTITNNYSTALDTFRADYQTYEEQLSSALGIDCNKEPIAFYDAVASARTKRTQVHSDVTTLNQYIDDYSAAFDSFAKTNGGAN
jgi:hypothetical protein